MKIATSYFAQIRNFKRNMIPISTACYDPKWFHADKGFHYRFYDKRGILNGLRCKDLAPGDSCNNLCRGIINCAEGPETCRFLKTYREQLSKISPDAFKSYCQQVVTAYSKDTGIPEDGLILVFLVFEKFDQPCSERIPLLEFFRSCGFDADELQYPIRDHYTDY